MRFYVTGAAGQVGRALLDLARARGHEAIGHDYDVLDVTKRDDVFAMLTEQRPDWVLHCAAATKVDSCESETEWAEALNADAAAYVAEACASIGASLLHYSTDFIFDGSKGSPYVEDDVPAPVSVYGATKARGEAAVRDALDAHLILRTQWVYAPGGRCFPAAILARARSGEPLKVVEDQTGSPTLSFDLAEASLDLIDRVVAGAAAPGTYHASCAGETTWYDFARAILDRAGMRELEVARIKSAELALPAARPEYSTLDCSKLEAAIGRSMPTWQTGLERWFAAEEADAAAATADAGASTKTEQREEA